MAIGVLVPRLEQHPTTPPEARPIGRAALQLEAEGVPVVFGELFDGRRMRGLRADAGGWREARESVGGVYDRFPSQTQAGRYAAIRQSMGGLPMVNPTPFTVLCRDKLETWKQLDRAGIAQPPIEADPARFQQRLNTWSVGFLKPRYGSFGRGVRRVFPGDSLPARGEGATPGLSEPLLLQQAVIAPVGFAGISARVLVQRAPSGWFISPAVARHSASDPVVNAARGAAVCAGASLLPMRTIDALGALAQRVAEALGSLPGGEWLAELGVDAAIDASWAPQLIEVNSRPRGRLAVLAEDAPGVFGSLHLQACLRPLRFLLNKT